MSVAYFSASGMTKTAAQKLVAKAETDIFKSNQVVRCGLWAV